MLFFETTSFFFVHLVTKYMLCHRVFIAHRLKKSQSKTNQGVVEEIAFTSCQSKGSEPILQASLLSPFWLRTRNCSLLLSCLVQHPSTVHMCCVSDRVQALGGAHLYFPITRPCDKLLEVALVQLSDQPLPWAHHFSLAPKYVTIKANKDKVKFMFTGQQEHNE